MHQFNGNDFGEAGYNYVECKTYKNESEPFIIYVSFQAMLMMNIHAHLFANEIIGWLSGYLIEQDSKKYMFIQEASVVKPMEHCPFDRKKSVEMDSEDAHIVSKGIEKRGQQILGWYHSHPVFEVNPSNIDVCTHNSYQENFNKDNKPFIGIIVGPYSKGIDHSGRYTSLTK